MATNRDLLKEAIADAKAVKETAIANAKAALEEAFTPQLKSMFAAKLHEMELEEDNLEEYSETHEDEFGRTITAKDVTGTEEDTMEIDLEELLRELENEDGSDETLNEAEEEEETEDVETSDEESEEEESEGEPIDLEDMTDEDLKSMIEDVIKDMVASGELEAGHEGMEDEEGAEEVGVEDEEEVDLAELLKEIEEMENNEVCEEKEPVNEIMADIYNLLGSDGVMGFLQGLPIFAVPFGIAVGMVAKAYRSWKKEEKLNQMKNIDVAKLAAKDSAFKTSDEGKAAAAAAEKDNKPVADNSEKELTEAYKTIKTLKSELNEINLLNAKLLYTNKIFKSKNLNEGQKVKVLSSFDKATTVGEVKLVFETLNEGIKVAKNTIKENLGSASKSTITPNVKKPIVESNDAFLRMQKLAGII